MANYIDFSAYSDSDILRMQKEKKKEYIILIQSEKIAKELLNRFGKSLYTTNYHYRINSEYYMLNERINKKKIAVDENENETIIRIPLSSVISRLKDSCKVVLNSNKDLYQSYSEVVNEVIDIVNSIDIPIIYKNGYLYFIKEDEEILVNQDSIDEIIDKPLQKIKH